MTYDMKEKKKTVWGRILRGILWFAGVWAVLLVVLQIVLSSPALGRIVEKFAGDYLYGDLRFESVKVNMFRHFPNVGIIMENGSLTYRADRFDEYEARSPQGQLLYAGCGQVKDTLASFDHFSASINVASLASGKIHVPHLSMVKPRIFAHSYGGGDANWNIVKLPEKISDEGTTKQKAGVPPMEIGDISLSDHPHIVFTSSSDTLFAMIDVGAISFSGKLDTGDAGKNKLQLKIEEMNVAGRIAADTVRLNMDTFHIHEHRDHFDIGAQAEATLATKAFGRMDIPVSIEGTAGIIQGDEPGVEMHGFNAEIAAIPIAFDMDIRKTAGGISLDGQFDIRDCRIEEMIDGFVKNIIPETAKIRTDASLSLSGTVAGELGGGRIPQVNAILSLPESYIRHQDIGQDIFLAFEAGVNSAGEDVINVSLNEVSLGTAGLALSVSGGVEDVLGGDPFISLDGKLRASADSLMVFMPEDSGITASGDLTAEVKGEISLSQMDIFNFGQANITGRIASERLVMKSPGDTIDVDIEDLSLGISPETRISTVDTGATFRMLSLDGKIGKAYVSLKDQIVMRTSGLDFAAKNSVDVISAISSKDTTKVHPLGGHLSARELAVEDGSGMALTMNETSNRFQMVPKEGSPEIPVLNLSSENRRISVRNSTNRLNLTNADLKVGATMNKSDRRRGNGERRGDRRPRAERETLQEDDFSSGDLNFTLEGAMAKYFREWDITGDLKVRSGLLMTPMLPQRNSLRGLDISLSNNEIRIDSLTVLTGDSDISAKGSLSGLRRALLGRGAYNLDLDITSERMDASQLLAALNAGSSVTSEEEADMMAEASDSEFMDMVTVDSLDTEGLKTLIIVPADLNANIRLNAGNISYSDLLIDRMTADITMKERCMQITGTEVNTNMGDLSFEGFFATRSKEDIKTGFNLKLTDITSEKVIAMLPAMDTIVPLVKSFKGKMNCEIAATAQLDTTMSLITPTINGVIRIKGDGLSLSEDKMFTNLAEKLHFKNSREAAIDRMTIEGYIRNNSFEVFPFVLDLDRYMIALTGVQNLDMSYRYHASIIKSPLLFKVGVSMYGPDFDNMKLKIGKPKYKSQNVPMFSAIIDRTRNNLSASIRNIYEKGVEQAIREHETQQTASGHTQEISFVNEEIEELSAEEQMEFDERQEKAEAGIIDEESIARTLEYIISNE